MPRALKTVPGFVTAGGAGTNAVAVSPGAVGTFSIDSFSNGKAYLEAIWGNGATLDFLRVRSGRLHDAQQGMRYQVGSIQRSNLIPWPSNQTLYPVDNLTVEADATGAGTQAVVLTYGFDDLGGTQQTIARWEEIQPRIIDIMGQEVDVTASATIGTYGAGVALNAFSDNWKAGTQYALLGFTCSVAVSCIALNGVNTSGQDIGFPGDTDARETRDYFKKMAWETQRACIPIIDANNKGATILKCVDIAASTATKVSLTLARLG
jgi:hypothetical protein